MSVSPDRWSRGGSPAGSDGPPQDDWVFEGSPLYGEVAYETRFTEERVVEGSPLYDETVYATLFTDELMVALHRTKNVSRSPSPAPSPIAYAQTDTPTLLSEAPSPTPPPSDYPTSMGFALMDRSPTVPYTPVETGVEAVERSSLKRTRDCFDGGGV